MRNFTNDGYGLLLRYATVFVVAFALGACASPPPPAALTEPVPRSFELQQDCAVATMHFPAGDYSLDSSDRSGFYYRAPQGIREHTFGGGFIRHEGGIFVAAADRARIRGYVIWAGGMTKLGDLSRAYYVFRE